MNVIDLLKKDHDLVSDLFKQYEKEKEGADSEEKKHALAKQICQELTVHATVEEAIFYPAVEAKATEQSDEEAEDGVHEADEEHALVKILVAELQEMQPSDQQFDAKVKVLMDLVEHHVEEEEGELMPRSRKLLEKDALEEMGAQVEARKEVLKQDLAAGRKPKGANPPGASPSRTAQSLASPISRTRTVQPARRTSSKAPRSKSPARKSPATRSRTGTARSKTRSSGGSRSGSSRSKSRRG